MRVDTLEAVSSELIGLSYYRIAQEIGVQRVSQDNPNIQLMWCRGEHSR